MKRTAFAVAILFLLGSHALFSQNDSFVKKLWNIDLGARITAKPIVNGNMVYVIVDRLLRALDIDEGRVKWQFTPNERMLASPYVTEDTVIILSEGGLVYNLNRTTGKVKKRATIPVEKSASILFAEGVVCSLTASSLKAYDAVNGAKIWERMAGKDQDFREGMVASEGIVYMTDHLGLYGYELKSGKVLVSLITGTTIDQFAVIGGVAFQRVSYVPAGPLRTTVMAMDIETRKTLWEKDTLASDRLRFKKSTEGCVILIDIKGASAHDLKTGDQVYSFEGIPESALIFDGHLFFSDERETLAIDLRSGRQRWRHVEGGAGSHLTIQSNLLLITQDQSLYAYEVRSDAKQRQNTARVRDFAASSTLAPTPANNPKYFYYPELAFDGDRETAWTEGVEGDGIGEWIRIELESEITVDSIGVMPGYFDARWWKDNNRIKRIKVKTDKHSFDLSCKDEMKTQKLSFKNHIKLREITFEIAEVYRDAKWKDTCISEIIFYLKGSEIELIFKNR